jgi:AcrR family transcriptional regulator
MGAPVTDDNAPADAPGMRQARGRARRAAVLAAAHSLFAAHGFERTSLKAIARAAGITDAGLLFHFPTKGALLLAVIAAGDREEKKLLDGLMQGAEGLAALQSLASWGKALERDPALTALDITLSAEHLQDVSEANSYYASRYERLRKHLARIFATARRAGDFKPDTNPMQEAVLMISALDGLRLQWILSKGKVSMARGMRAYVTATIERLSLRSA